MKKKVFRALSNLKTSIQFEEVLNGQKFIFRTKPGLFSKDKVDNGTKLLIKNMEINPDDIVLDLGCGYGAIGLSASKLALQGIVYMVDTDFRAIHYSSINALANNIKNVEILISDGFQNVPDIKFDVILSNPPTHGSNQLLDEFISGASQYLKHEGTLYLVTETRIFPFIKRLLKEYFGDYEIIESDKTYTVSAAKKN